MQTDPFDPDLADGPEPAELEEQPVASKPAFVVLGPDGTAQPGDFAVGGVLVPLSDRRAPDARETPDLGPDPLDVFLVPAPQAGELAPEAQAEAEESTELRSAWDLLRRFVMDNPGDPKDSFSFGRFVRGLPTDEAPLDPFQDSADPAWTDETLWSPSIQDLGAFSTTQGDEVVLPDLVDAPDGLLL